VAERLVYLSSDLELVGIAERVANVATKATQTQVIYNNNDSDYPLRNAATFQQLLARKYPQLLTGPRPTVQPGSGVESARTQEFAFATEAVSEPRRRGRKSGS
jgi:hypothetical protein